jgi:hypothetical protein
MVNLDVAQLRPKLDLEGKYVDFSVLRTALSVAAIARDLNITLTEPTKEGECRGNCPKCQKEKSFSLNISTNRFNCFAKGCVLKGGGVIDFFGKLFEVSAKEASHLLACAYGISPYTQAMVVDVNNQTNENPTVKAEQPVQSREVPESSADLSQTALPLTTPAHLIASIEQQLAELKQLLTVQ